MGENINASLDVFKWQSNRCSALVLTVVFFVVGSVKEAKKALTMRAT
jgi:hypothetical protein